jgi:hypothetical protein
MPVQIGRWITFEIDISDSTTISDEVNLGGNYQWLMLEVPTIDTAILTVHVAREAGGTFRSLHTAGADTQIASDSGTGDFMWGFPIHGAQFIKVVASAAQTADRTFYARGTDRYVQIK